MLYCSSHTVQLLVDGKIMMKLFIHLLGNIKYKMYFSVNGLMLNSIKRNEGKTVPWRSCRRMSKQIFPEFYLS